jgi:tRNA(fMet)-specific endonuclease VapC
MVTGSFLLDANVLSEPLRPRPDPLVVERLRLHRGGIATCAPVLHELIFGYCLLPESRRRQAIQQYVTESVQRTMPILPYDATAAEWHAAERARLVAAGLTPPYLDGQIAAIAAVNRLILVTANQADFRHFHGLQIEDWRS